MADRYKILTERHKLSDLATTTLAELSTVVDFATWKSLYTNGSSVLTELALGAQYTSFISGGAAAAPSWALISNDNLAGAGICNIDWDKLAASASLGYAVITDPATGYLTTEQYLAVGRGGTGTGALTEGSVVFAGAGGTYTQDNAHLFWDAGNGRFGVGTNTPAALFEASVSDIWANQVKIAARFTHHTGAVGGGAAGMGVRADWVATNDAGADTLAGVVQAEWSDPAAGSEDSILRFYYMKGGALTEGLAVSLNGITVPAMTTDGPVYSASGVLSSEQYLDVTRGGTGVGTLTDHGVLVGSGTGDITALAVGTANYLLMGVNAADPTWGLLTNDNVAASGVANIAWNKLAAGTGNAALRTGATGYPEVVPVNATGTNKFLRQVSSGAPSFETLAASDIPALSYAPAWAGLTVGSILYASAATTVGEITAVPKGRFLVSNGTGVVPYYPAAADLTWDEANDRLGIGVASPAYPLDVDGVIANSGDIRAGGSILSYGPGIEVGQLANGAGNRYAYVDLIGDDTYTDYGLRLIRDNTGANTTSRLTHRGTGLLSIVTEDAAALVLKTSGTERVRVLSSGEVGVNYATPTWDLEVRDLADSTYGLLFDAGGQRISGAKGAAGNLGLYSDGIAAATGGMIWIAGSASANKSAILFHQDGSEVMRIDGGAAGHNPGYVGIGTSTPDYPLDVGGVIRCFNSLLIAGNTSGEITFSAPSVVTSGAYIWPADDGDDTNLLATDGGGNLSWSNIYAASHSWTGTNTFTYRGLSVSGTYYPLIIARVHSDGVGAAGLSTGLKIQHENDASTMFDGASFVSTVSDASSGAESAEVDLSARVSGTLTRILNLSNVGLRTGGESIEVNGLGSGNRNAYIDLVGDATYSDYGFRLIRNNGGANTTTQLLHRGTGDLEVQTQEGAYITFKTTGNLKYFLGPTANPGLFCQDHTYRPTASSYYARWDASTGCARLGQNSSSDARLKANVRDISSEMDVLARLDDLRGVYFNWIDSPRTEGLSQTARQIGCIAQEVREVLPEVIMSDGEYDPDEILGVDYMMMVPYLLECLKALKVRVEQLEGQGI